MIKITPEKYREIVLNRGPGNYVKLTEEMGEEARQVMKERTQINKILTMNDVTCGVHCTSLARHVHSR